MRFKPNKLYRPRPLETVPDIRAVGSKYRLASFCRKCQQVIVYLPHYKGGPLTHAILASSWRGEPGLDSRTHVRHQNHASQTERIPPPTPFTPMAD